MPPAIDQRKLGEMLVDRGLITVEQLEEALNEQRASGRFPKTPVFDSGTRAEVTCLEQQLSVEGVEMVVERAG